MSGLNEQLKRKQSDLARILTEMGRVVVAFSGGVDSTLLLKVAADVLGGNVLAVTVHSPVTPVMEREAAAQLVADLHVEHLILSADELSIEEFAANPPNRCYVCKKRRFSDLINVATARGFLFVVDGENADDAGDYRPGSVAARELGVRSPLREAGLTKAEIRCLSKELGLPTCNKPSYACLASRIPYGSPITEEKLRQVEAAEEFIRGLLPDGQLRVRHYGDTARIEVDRDRICELARDEIRERIVRHLQGLGFRFVTLDLHGYRTGSLNPV